MTTLARLTIHHHPYRVEDGKFAETMRTAPELLVLVHLLSRRAHEVPSCNRRNKALPLILHMQVKMHIKRVRDEMPLVTDDEMAREETGSNHICEQRRDNGPYSTRKPRDVKSDPNEALPPVTTLRYARRSAYGKPRAAGLPPFCLNATPHRIGSRCATC